jgi:hypothetical protein
VTNYHVETWAAAKDKAEFEVMRCSATPDGGRKQGETVDAYYERTREIQLAAYARYLTACDELQKAKIAAGHYVPGR